MFEAKAIMKTNKDSGCRADEERKQGKKKVVLKVHTQQEALPIFFILSTPIDKNIHVYGT